jgi:hypothetical protein
MYTTSIVPLVHFSTVEGNPVGVIFIIFAHSKQMLEFIENGCARLLGRGLVFTQL